MAVEKSRILIVGCQSEVNDNIVKSLDEKVQGDEICFKNVENPMFIIEATEYQPDLVVISTEALDDFCMIILQNILSGDAFKGVPVIALGHKEENDKLVASVQHEPIECLNRPIQMLYVAKTVRDYLKMQKKYGRGREAGDKKHILVVDDTVAMLHSLQSYLEPAYYVTIMNGGRSALEFLKVQKPDLILLDYMMPDLDGVEVYKAILKNPETKDIPVFFLTSVSEENKVKECLSLKPAGYILKPVPKAILLETLHDFFDVI